MAGVYGTRDIEGLIKALTDLLFFVFGFKSLVMGPSGAGKSTVLDIIAKRVPATEGRVSSLCCEVDWNKVCLTRRWCCVYRLR